MCSFCDGTCKGSPRGFYESLGLGALGLGRLVVALCLGLQGFDVHKGFV